ncbi:toll/interleukin-1 receptor domain-containing protein [Dankookia rubra]|uniref:Toll/interleukin-1 receptor domain-containing protein n=1 Tax=Dankookia rubra TaxID=1442381 RepID=A0A4R5QBN2_9PROT|nr:toll/interleukin-1 receptor domain-containing protein [Dankookia rubra]TDH59801.1 toll/interleukin-1 receptor domain-containing protein [Dankookia rubra]
MRQRVFVSHVNGDPDTDAVLPSLCDALRAAGLDVLVDTERLRPGASWRQEIYGWLGLCHAAIVLVSRAALEDPAKIWVTREATLLVWRRALDPMLRIVPVLLGDVQPGELAGGRLADLLLNETQCARAGSDLGSLARAVANGLAAAPTPLEQLAEALAHRLGAVPVAVVEAAAGIVGIDLGPWRPEANPRHALMLGLLCAPFEDAACALEYIADHADTTARGSLVEVAVVLGANWVEPEAARWLAAQDPSGRAAVLNASTQFAAECYVQRACGRPPPGRWPVVPLTAVTGEETAAELRAEVEAALERVLLLTRDAFEPASVALRRLLQRRRREGRATFLLARLPPEPGRFVAALRGACPDAAAILLGGDLEEEDADALGSACRVLRPMLPPGADREARTRLDDLLLRITGGA